MQANGFPFRELVHWCTGGFSAPRYRPFQLQQQNQINAAIRLLTQFRL